MAGGDFTALLADWRSGDASALDRLTPLVYQELRRLANARLRNEREAHTLQPTALVHEAYLRLVDRKQQQYENRAHFLSIASSTMRQILVDNARRFRAAKRGGDKVPLEEAVSFAPERGQALLELDEALSELARFDPRKSRLVELKYFGGLTGEEITEALGISISTVTRDTRLAEAWLGTYLAGSQ